MNTRIPTVSLIEILVKEQLIKPDQVPQLRQHDDFDLFCLIRRQVSISEGELLTRVGRYVGMEFRPGKELVTSKQFQDEFHGKRLQDMRLLPVYKDNRTVCFAVDNPYNPALEDLSNQFHSFLKIILLTEADLNILWSAADQGSSGDEFTPLTRIIFEAIDQGASDIHLNKLQNGCEVKFRILGQLQLIRLFQQKEESQILNLIKLHSHMDVSKTTLPQDGHLSVVHKQRQFDVRVSCIPTVFGEDVVMRIMAPFSTLNSLAALGFSAPAKELIQKMIHHSSGLVLVTGPTGSGKTTTLYTILTQLAGLKKNVVTLEDPVEYVLGGIRQSPINVQAGYTFTAGLKHILRQDPDIIMVGEIREAESARIALDAAYTGHLVVSTLHTQDVRSTLLRLRSFGLDPFMLAHCLKGVICQQLIGQECRACAGKGCAECHFRGIASRLLMSEILSVSQPVYNPEKPFSIDELIRSNSFYSFQDDRKLKGVH